MKPLTDSRKVYDCCPVCESTIRFWRSKLGDGVSYQIERCSECGYAFINPRPSQAWLTNFYNKSGHHTSEFKLTDNPTLDSILAREKIEPNSTIDARRMIGTIRGLSKRGSSVNLLDVGCGYGLFSREALDQGFSVTALELASNERGIAAELLGIKPIASSFEDFSPPPPSVLMQC